MRTNTTLKLVALGILFLRVVLKWGYKTKHGKKCNTIFHMNDVDVDLRNKYHGIHPWTMEHTSIPCVLCCFCEINPTMQTHTSIFISYCVRCYFRYGQPYQENNMSLYICIYICVCIDNFFQLTIYGNNTIGTMLQCLFIYRKQFSREQNITFKIFSN